MVVKTTKGKKVDIPDNELDKLVDQLDISLGSINFMTISYD